MGIKSGVGLSTAEDLVVAAREAALDAQVGCPDASAVLVFVTFNYPAEKLREASVAVAALFPKGTIIAGGTVNGLTFGDGRYDAFHSNKRAVGVVAYGGTGLRVGVGFVPDPSSAPREAGKTLAKQVLEALGGHAEGGILLSTGLSSGLTPVDQPLIDGVRAVSPRLRMAGTGLSGGMLVSGMIEPGYAFLGERVEKLGCLLLAFDGAIKLGFSTANGMEAVGPGGFVTEVDGLIIKQINGRPARDAAVDLLAGSADAETRSLFEKNPWVMQIERGVTLGTPDPEGDFYWSHMPVIFTPDGGAVDYFGARKGTALSLVKVDRESCMKAIGEAVTMLEEDAGATEFESVLAFSCALRGFSLGAEMAHEDVELRRHVKSKTQLGVVACGEIGCYRHGRPFYTGWVYALFGLAGSERP